MRQNKMIAEFQKKIKQRKRQSWELWQKYKKPVRISNVLTSWKMSTALFLASLIMVILVLPTLIVLPFMSQAEEETAAAKQDETAGEAGEAEAVIDDSPFAIDVMRDDSEQVDTVPLEKYVTRVVASETPAEFDPEALKAQALAARTFVVNRKLYKDDGDDDAGHPDVTDTTDDQVYHDKQELKNTMGSAFEENMHKIKQAVADTKGEILTYDGELITPAYFSTSNGYTENSEDYWDEKVPYLRSVKSPWDKDTEKFMEQEVFTVADFEEQLGTDLPSIDDLSMGISQTEGNRVDELTLNDESFSGREVREALDLPSSDFSIDKKQNHLIVTTKGFGHGIGMSQYGANGMAEAGKTYDEIVKHYYQDVQISTVSDAAPTLASKE